MRWTVDASDITYLNIRAYWVSLHEDACHLWPIYGGQLLFFVALISATLRLPYTHWSVGKAIILKYMMTSSCGNLFRVTGHLCGEFTGHRWIPRTKASDAELWCFVWSALRINGWVNNREAGDLRHQRAYYDVIVMKIFIRVIHWYSIPLHWCSVPSPRLAGRARDGLLFSVPRSIDVSADLPSLT